MRHAPQPMEPHGLVGQVFGLLMEHLNAPVYQAAIEELKPRPGQAWLDVGFGTGAFLGRLARGSSHGTLCGVDPSAQMVRRARQRLSSQVDFTVDLRRGTVADLSFERTFDGAVALHCFQFWPDPARGIQVLCEALRPGAALLFALRDHGTSPPSWLPNPLSRAGHEGDALMELLAGAGLAPESRGSISGSTLIVARHRDS